MPSRPRAAPFYNTCTARTVLPTLTHEQVTDVASNKPLLPDDTTDANLGTKVARLRIVSTIPLANSDITVVFEKR